MRPATESPDEPVLARAARPLAGAAIALLLGACGGDRGGDPGGVRGGAGVESVVVIDLDTLRADALGCYGNPRPTSPAIDALAAAGVRFAWAFAQAPNTPPSQASILTGLYPSRHGRRGDLDAVRPEVVTLAESLRAGGIRTAAFVDGGFMAAGFGLEQGFERYDDARGAGLREVSARATRWLGELGPDERFFLLLHAYDVHAPYEPPEPYRASFAASVPSPSPGFRPTVEALEAARKAGHAGARPSLPPEDAAYARALYDAEVRAADDAVRDLLAELDRSGRARRAAVVLVSDHGEEFLEHGSVLHEKLYATVLRVPLVVRLPGRPGGRVVDSVVQTVDLAPTVLELLGVAGSAAYDGRSLAGELAGERPPAAISFAESPFFGEERSLVAGSWRLLVRRGAPAELYRFREDPAEQRDLAPRAGEQAARLAAALGRIEAGLEPARRGERAPAAPSEEAVRQLRALGYL